MADNENAKNSSSNADLVSLDDTILESGAGASAGESILNAPQIFQQQLDQMTAWKQQLADQMDLLRRDGVKLLERQKALSAEKKRLAEEREALNAEHAKSQQAVQKLEERAGQLEQLQQKLNSQQQALESTNHALQQREGELKNQQASVAQREAHTHSEDARLKQGVEQLAAAQRDAAQQREAISAQQKQLEEEKQALARQRQELQKRRDAIEEENAEQLEALAKQTKRINERRAEIDAQGADLDKALQARISEATEALQAQLAQARQDHEQRESSHAQRIAQFEHQLQQYQSAAQQWKAEEARHQAELAATTQQADQLKEQLARAGGELENARRDIAARQAQLEQARAQGGDGSANSQALAQQIATLEKQRDELAAQLFSIQDAGKAQQEEALLAKNAVEGQLVQLKQQNSALEAEIKAWKAKASAPSQATGKAVTSEEVANAQAQVAFHRERLIRQAKSVRSFRQQIRESKDFLEKNRGELAQQREQLRARKENLEQVKRLLEKQEMVMARKLADHNAIKTVAAVGIFVIMVLGSVFFGVYRFANPVYRAEAIVQLAPPATAHGVELEAWFTRQKEFLKSTEVTTSAWKALRSPDEHYAMHDVREEWLATLPKLLTLQLDEASKTVAIRYTGPASDGVAQVCNALAVAYTTPMSRDATEGTVDFGNGATIVAKAEPPRTPVEDSRLTLSLSVVAVVLFVSLILVMIFRYFVARQLKEIDDMAEEQELAEIQGEIPSNANPA